MAEESVPQHIASSQGHGVKSGAVILHIHMMRSSGGRRTSTERPAHRISSNNHAISENELMSPTQILVSSAWQLSTGIAPLMSADIDIINVDILSVVPSILKGHNDV
jgi:uncharacterized protein (DUF849 family)